jgi:hypothetical protein
MKKKRFRIIQYKNGDVTFYETKIKTWIGWISFTVFYKTDIIHIISDPVVQRTLAFERIYQYCEIKGFKKNDISVAEIIESGTIKWVFLKRICIR